MFFSDWAFSTAFQISDFPNPAPLYQEVHLNCILLIDDNRATNFLHKRLLDKMGVANTIRVARNGSEGMDYLERAAQGDKDCPVPNLIFLDINMPLINGWEFLDRYRSLPTDFKKNITLLMLTTSLREDDIEQAGKLPLVKGLLHKPLTEKTLRKALAENFGASGYAAPRLPDAQ